MYFNFSSGFIGQGHIVFPDQFPTGIPEHEVNEEAASFKFGIIRDDRRRFRALNGLCGNALDKCICRCRYILTWLNRDTALGNQLFVERCQRSENAKLQQRATDEIVEVEKAEVSFAALDAAGVSCDVAHLADVMGRCHQAIILHEFHEGFPGHQLVERLALANFRILEGIDGLDQPFESLATMQGTGVVV